MKKIAVLFLLLSNLCLAGNLKIVESLANGRATGAKNALSLELKGQTILPLSYIEWKGANVGGMNRIDFYGVEVTSGNATTLSATPILSTGEVLSGEEQTVTSGTDLTVIKSNYYRFRLYNNVAITTNVTLNFLIAD